VLPRFLGEDSLLLCSGILDSRLEDVVAALKRAGLDIVHIHAKEDWRSICAAKRR
jgi:ribosomal protein L11 methylase PrmA